MKSNKAIDLNGAQIKNLGDPTTGTDAANKTYVDNAAAARANGLTINVAAYATTGQINGTADATSAWQAAVDAARVAGGGTIISPSNATWWFSGTSYVYLSSPTNAPLNNTVFDGQGCKIFKTSESGYYVIFQDSYSRAGLGYGSGCNNLTFQNFNLQGSFSSASPAGLCFLATNHSRNILIRNIIFNQTMWSGHSLEIDGSDDITIEDCTWYGFNDAGANSRAESINLDISAVGTGTAVDGMADGLACENVTVRNCKFLPWTDPATGTKWPGPNPGGSHSSFEGHTFKNIVFEDILIVDPTKDPANTGVGGDNPYVRGMIHFPAVEGLRVQARVVATDGQGCSRIVQVTSTSNGYQAGTAAAPVTGAYASPDVAKDIDIDLSVSGFGGTLSALNPLVYVGGLTDTKTLGVYVKLKNTGPVTYRENVYLWNVEGATVDMVRAEGGSIGARIYNCDKISVRGNFKNSDIPVDVRGSNRVAVGPIAAQSGVTKSYVIITDTNSNYITASNIVATGYTKLYSALPVNHAESAILGPTV